MNQEPTQGRGHTTTTFILTVIEERTGIKMPKKTKIKLAAVMFVASTGIIATADDPGVSNGSFRDPSMISDPAWFRSDPCVVKTDVPNGGCDIDIREMPWEGERFISIGPSVVYRPESITSGSLPPSSSTASDESCEPFEGERLSVLRLRANHPNAPLLTSLQSTADSGIGNVYQTDIHLPDAVGEALDTHVVVVRFDHLGLHPTGGPALRVGLIAERFRGVDGGLDDVIDWGASWELMPFKARGFNHCFSFEKLVLGSPRYRCRAGSGDPDDFWMPRQMPLDCPADRPGCADSSCPQDGGGIPLIPSLLASASNQDPSAPAAWRTNELRVAVKRLPDWNPAAGLEQIADYRFTLAFKLPEETVFLGSGSQECPGPWGCDRYAPPSVYRQSQRFAAYSEIDQVEIGLAMLEESAFGECDFPFEGSYDQRPSASSCPAWVNSGSLGLQCVYRPRDGARPLDWDPEIEPLGPGEDDQDIESERMWSTLEYLDSDPYDQAIWVCVTCEESLNQTAYRREVREGDYTPATFLEKEPPCPADFNGDGRVDGIDVGGFLGAWNSSDRRYDLDGNGTVGPGDLGLLLGAWGSCG